MTTELSAHLSEEALDDVLIGLSTPESEAHLAVCSACRSHVEGFQSGLQAFNQASLAWSEARPVSASMPTTRASLQAAARSKARRAMFAPLGWAMAVAVLLMIGIPIWNRDHPSPPNPEPSTASAMGDSEAQIAKDNELLKSVDMALSVSDESPLSEYRLLDEHHSHLKKRPELRSR
jgi:anti-sigma factor RsiW